MDSGLDLMRRITMRIATAEGRLTAAADGKLLAHASTACIVLPAPA